MPSINASRRSCLGIVTVAALCIAGVTAQGSVVGTAQPGTMASTFTIPFSEYDSSTPSGCGSEYAGCTGELATKQHAVAGSVTVLDDCTFRIEGWQFDGGGPAVEWWGNAQSGRPSNFPYPSGARKIGELGSPGNYQTGSRHGGDSDVVVRLGLDSGGNQIVFSQTMNHVSVWCEDFAVDFGNAAITCPDGGPAVAPSSGTSSPARSAATVVTAVAAGAAAVGVAVL